MANSQRLWTIIPAAGKSARFVAAGYRTPKPLLLINGKPMLQHVLETLPQDNVLIGLPPGYRCDYSCYRIPATRGQVDTCLQLMYNIPDEDAVLIADCDMVVHDISMLLNDTSSVAVLVTPTESTAMSYVDRHPEPTRFAEKQRISQWGIVGVRKFNHAGRLREAMWKAMSYQQEPYLTHAMQYLPPPYASYRIGAYEDYGTPEAVLASGATLCEPKTELQNECG